MFGFPQVTVARIDGKTLGIAVAIAPDRRDGPGSSDKRIVWRYAAVRKNAVDFSSRRCQALSLAGRSILHTSLPDAKEQMAVLKNQPATKEHVTLLILVPRDQEDRFMVFQTFAAQPGPDDPGHCCAGRARIAERKIKPAVLREVGIGDN